MRNLFLHPLRLLVGEKPASHAPLTAFLGTRFVGLLRLLESLLRRLLFFQGVGALQIAAQINQNLIHKSLYVDYYFSKEYGLVAAKYNLNLYSLSTFYFLEQYDTTPLPMMIEK